MVVKKEKPKDLVHHTLKLLFNPEMDLHDKKMLLGQLASDDSSESTKIINDLLVRASEELAKDSYIKKQQQLEELMQMIKDGPLRLGTYLGPAPAADGPHANRAHVLLENGDTTFPVITDPKMLGTLTVGDTVLLDAQARAVIVVSPSTTFTGEVGELKQRIGDDRVRVSLNDLNSEAFRLSGELKRQLDTSEVHMGDEILVCSRRRMAFEALPRAEGLSHYKFLEQGPLPEIDAVRDIGNPHPYIQELIDHVRHEMTNPDLARKYKVRPMQTRLLKGPTGTGKTLSILAVIRGIYDVMSEITGAPIEALPQRVMRMRMSQMLDKYLGESDKRQDRFYDEVIQLANEPFVWNGREWKLPVIARCEEIDSLARARNGSEDVMGRIQTTALERLDHQSGELGNSLCIFLFTTNVPELCDQAFIRRAGGQIIDLGRIGRGQFQAILAKKIRGLPMHSRLGPDQENAERRVARDVTNWVFSPNGHDPGQVEITFAGSASTTVKYRRDLLTGSVVDLSVQQASADAKRIDVQGIESPGLTPEMVMSSLDRQIRGACEQITEFNIHNYVSLPEGARVASVRRIEQPVVQPFELERI
ncbi:MAG: AAA family ATPase [Pirellulales bacterium]